jgi:hypothetical protein
VLPATYPTDPGRPGRFVSAEALGDDQADDDEPSWPMARHLVAEVLGRLIAPLRAWPVGPSDPSGRRPEAPGRAGYGRSGPGAFDGLEPTLGTPER